MHYYDFLLIWIIYRTINFVSTLRAWMAAGNAAWRIATKFGTEIDYASLIP